MLERKIFCMKPKQQYHLFEWRECVCGVQSWNESRLFCESVFIPTERWASILKMVEEKVFLLKPKHQYHLPHKENMFMGPYQEIKGDYFVNPCLSQLREEIQFEKW